MATQFVDADFALHAPATAAAPRRYLIGPVADFMTFGGSTLIILPLMLVLPIEQYKLSVAAAMLFLAHFINHPHFAHSYQLFYRGFARKAFTSALGREMQARYLVAGIIAPVLLIGFLAYAIAARNLQLLAYAGNAMGFFVGWHYVKQGYGLLMVDCALKKRFFADPDKKLLLINSYAVWMASWVAVNQELAKSEMWGIRYFAFDLPGWLGVGTAAAALGTTLVTAKMFAMRWQEKGSLPANGVIAYCVSLYPWLAFVKINPVWLLVVPALHSLQYLAVVWRFQTNYEKANLATSEYKANSIVRGVLGDRPMAHLALFCVIGGVLGFFGFWFAPALLGAFVAHDQALFGGTVFLFVAWVFINVHHYFMDNVMWRRDNPDTKLYLFN